MKLLLLLLLALGCMGVSLGLDCSPFARPWLVRFSSGQTGVLINKHWVLTKFSYDGGSQQLVARLGVDDLNGNSDTEQMIPVASWINHSPYRRRRKRSPVNDLALVRLAQPAKLTPHVQPIALPTQCLQTGELCVVSGWGSPEPDTGSRKQQCVVQQVLSDAICAQLNPMYWTSNVFCTKPQKSTECNCLSDSSSILVCGGVLQGVSGFGFLSGGCSSGQPDTYSTVCRYRSWINSVMSTMTPTMGPPTPPTPTTTTTMTTTTPPANVDCDYEDIFGHKRTSATTTAKTTLYNEDEEYEAIYGHKRTSSTPTTTTTTTTKTTWYDEDEEYEAIYGHKRTSTTPTTTKTTWYDYDDEYDVIYGHKITSMTPTTTKTPWYDYDEEYEAIFGHKRTSTTPPTTTPTTTKRTWYDEWAAIFGRK